MDQENTTICPHCKNPVLNHNFIVHEAQCENIMKKKNEEMSSEMEKKRSLEEKKRNEKEKKRNEEELARRNRVIIEQEYPKPKKEIGNYRLESVIDEYECPNCREKIRISSIEEHQSSCLERPITCEFCRDVFPFSLMEDHQLACKNIQGGSNVLGSQSNLPSSIYPVPNPQSYPVHNPQGQQEEIKEQVLENGSIERTQVRRLPNGQIQYIKTVNGPYGQSTSISFSNGGFDPGMSMNMSNMSMGQNLGQNMGQNFMRQENFFPDESDVPSQINSFSSFNQNNFARDPFENFEQFFRGTFSRFPRGFAIRPLMGGVFNMNDLPFFLSQMQSSNRGISKEECEEFESYPFVKRPGLSEDDLKCVVCYSDFAEGEKIRCLPCFHKFHVECIDTWLMKNSKCPVCKHNVSREEPGNEFE